MITGLHMANLSNSSHLTEAGGDHSVLRSLNSAGKTGNAATLSGSGSHSSVVDKLDVPTRAGSAGRTSALSVELSVQTKALAEAIALLQTVDAALVEMDKKLGEMTELAEEAAKPGHSKYERAILNVAFQKLKGDVDGIADSVTFNGEQILKGGDGPDGALTREFGAGENAFTVTVPPATLADLSADLVSADISTLEGAVTALDNLQEAAGNLDVRRRNIALEIQSIASEQFLIGVAAMAEQTAAAGREVLDQPDAALEFSKKIARDIARQAEVFLSEGAAEGVQQLLTGLNTAAGDDGATGDARTSDPDPNTPGPSLESAA